MFVAVEGCIAVGKTTLAKVLAEAYNGKVLLEETKKHPFIAEFYVDPEGYAFQTEMNFILIHYHQLQKAQKNGVFNGLVFSDFLFEKDFVFASLTLRDPEEQRLFRLTYDFLKKRIPTPALLIYLKAPTDFLYERIRKRGRELEAPMPFDYLDRLNHKYDQFFDQYEESQKIVLDATHLDSGNRDDPGIAKVQGIIAPFLDNLVNIPPNNK